MRALVRLAGALVLASGLAGCSTPQPEPIPEPDPPVAVATAPADPVATVDPTPAAVEPAPAETDDPRFDTCKDANAASYGPYRQGVDPEYDWYQDRDSDGINCEPAS